MNYKLAKKKPAINANYWSIKYVEITFTKEVKDIDPENNKMSMKGIKKDHKWLERYSMLMDWKNIAKISTLPRQYTDFHTTKVVSITFFTEIKNNPKISMEP